MNKIAVWNIEPDLTSFTINYNEQTCADIFECLSIDTLLKLEMSFIDTALTVLPEAIFEFTNLKILHLNNIDIIELPETICKLKNLEEIWIYNTKINTLPECIGDLLKLKKLEIELNEITHLPTSIGKLVELECLCLFDNCLTSLPTEIGQLHNLKMLDLKRNYTLNNLPESIHNLNNIMELGLTITKETAKVFNNLYLPKLEILEVDSEVSRVFDRILFYSHLKELYVHDSDLTDIPDRNRSITRFKGAIH